MALGVAEFTELVASTLRKIEPQLFDNVTTKHPLLELVRSEISSETGRALVVNLELAEDSSTQWTDESGTFATAKSGEIIGSAVYEWSDPLVSSVRIPWKTLKMNQGKQQVINLLKSHISSMQKAHGKKIVTTLHDRVNDGLNAAGVPNSLDMIVSDAAYDANPTGAAPGAETPFKVGGIDSTAQPLWQAQRVELPVDGTYSIRKAFRHLSNEIYVATGSTHQPDAAVVGRDVFEEFEDSFDDKVRYDSFGDGQTRFTQITHGDLTVRLDPDCPAKRAYFLTTDQLYFRSLAGAFMESQDAQSLDGNLDKVHPVASVLAFGTSERRAHGVLLRPATAGGDA